MVFLNLWLYPSDLLFWYHLFDFLKMALCLILFFFVQVVPGFTGSPEVGSFGCWRRFERRNGREAQPSLAKGPGRRPRDGRGDKVSQKREQEKKKKVK